MRAGGRHVGFQGRRVGDHQAARIIALLIGCKPWSVVGRVSRL